MRPRPDYDPFFPGVGKLADQVALISGDAAVAAYQGHKTLIDYASTKGAIVSFTRSLAQVLTKQRTALTRWRPARYGRR